MQVATGDMVSVLYRILRKPLLHVLVRVYLSIQQLTGKVKSAAAAQQWNRVSLCYTLYYAAWCL